MHKQKSQNVKILLLGRTDEVSCWDNCSERKSSEKAHYQSSSRFASLGVDKLVQSLWKRIPYRQLTSGWKIKKNPGLKKVYIPRAKDKTLKLFRTPSQLIKREGSGVQGGPSIFLGSSIWTLAVQSEAKPAISPRGDPPKSCRPPDGRELLSRFQCATWP